MADVPALRPSEPRQPRAGKSLAAFRTISEVSAELDVPQHVLRFWETKFAQVKPMKRAGGRRYYRPEDVSLLRTIRDLLYREGFTIRGAQKHLREGTAKAPAAANGAAGATRERPPAAEPARPRPLEAPAPRAAEPEPRKIDRASLEAVLEELEGLRSLLRARLG